MDYVIKSPALDLLEGPPLRAHSFITEFDLQSSRGKNLPSYMDKVTEVHSLLLDKVNSLNVFISEVLKRQEREYLKAMKVQMVQVNAHVDQLKKKSGVKKLEMKKEEEMQKLQETLSWVKEEALKLEQSCKKTKDECNRWKVKAEGLESDRKFLEKQLKQAMRQIRMMEAGGSKNKAETHQLPALHKSNLLTVDLPNTKSGQYLSQLISSLSPMDPELFLQLERYMSSQESQFHSTIKHYQKTLLGEKKKLSSLNSTFSNSFMTKTDLEDVFFDCVEEVRKTVSKRMHTASSHYRRSSMPENQPNLYLTSSDKLKILELLVENEQVLALLHEQLFPYKKQMSQGQEKSLKDIPEEELQDLVQLSKALDAKEKDRSWRRISSS